MKFVEIFQFWLKSDAIIDTLHEDLDAVGCADRVLRSKSISNER